PALDRHRRVVEGESRRLGDAARRRRARRRTAAARSDRDAARARAESDTMILDDDHRAVQDAVRAYVQDRIAPNAAQWDRDAHFPKDELAGLAALGCYGVAVPAAYDGAGLDYLALAVILEEIAAGDGATSTIVSVNNCPVCSILMAFADDAQKERWLKPLARGEMLGAFCLTEPHVGSEAGGLRTTAVREGDAYVL